MYRITTVHARVAQVICMYYVRAYSIRRYKEISIRMDEATRVMGITALKKKQKEAIVAFIQSRDTFVVLPTGYGKSLIYAVLPLVFDRLRGKPIHDSCMWHS